MQVIKGEAIFEITNRRNKPQQEAWFRDSGITFNIDADGKVFTTDDWMNGKDKYQASNDDGFNLGALNHAS